MDKNLGSNNNYTKFGQLINRIIIEILQPQMSHF